MDSGRWYSTIKECGYLVTWTLTIARFSIRKAPVNFRVNKEVTPTLSIFRAIVKSIIRFQFKVYVSKGTQYLFPGVWCIGYIFVKFREQCVSIYDIRVYHNSA